MSPKNDSKPGKPEAEPSAKRRSPARTTRKKARKSGAQSNTTKKVSRQPSSRAEGAPPAKKVRRRATKKPQVETPTAVSDADEQDAELGIGSRMAPLPVSEESPESLPSPDQPAQSPEEIIEQIRALEARLEGMIAPQVVKPPLPRQVSDAPQRQALVAPRNDDFYSTQWGRTSLRLRAEEVDDFGLDRSYEDKLRPLLDFLHRSYFRTEVSGIANVPNDGRCVLVANHSGTLPIDGMMLRTAMRLHHPTQRELRWLAEDFIFYLPFVGAFMNRIGAVRACPENAERLLKQGNLVAVFPEGIQGIRKLYRHRYRLQRFGRGGFVRLCMRTQTPLVPCAVVGAEEANPMLYRIEHISKVFGLPYVPVTPTFPWLGPLGLIPAPVKWRIVFGEPMSFNEYGPRAAEDHILVGRLSEQVKESIQGLLRRGLTDRQSVWTG